MSEAKKLDPEDIDNYFNENRSIRDTAAHFDISINKVWNIIERFDDGDDGLQLACDYMEVYKELFCNEDDDFTDSSNFFEGFATKPRYKSVSVVSFLIGFCLKLSLLLILSKLLIISELVSDAIYIN